jgi:hypothetical protein
MVRLYNYFSCSIILDFYVPHKSPNPNPNPNHTLVDFVPFNFVTVVALNNFLYEAIGNLVLHSEN